MEADTDAEMDHHTNKRRSTTPSETRRQSYWIPLRETKPDWALMKDIKAEGGSVHNYILDRVFENHKDLIEELQVFQIYNYRITFMFKPMFEFNIQTFKIGAKEIYVRRTQEKSAKVYVIGLKAEYSPTNIKKIFNQMGETTWIQQNTFWRGNTEIQTRNYTAYFKSRAQRPDNVEGQIKVFYNKKEWDSLPRATHHDDDIASTADDSDDDNTLYYQTTSEESSDETQTESEDNNEQVPQQKETNQETTYQEPPPQTMESRAIESEYKPIRNEKAEKSYIQQMRKYHEAIITLNIKMKVVKPTIQQTKKSKQESMGILLDKHHIPQPP